MKTREWLKNLFKDLLRVVLYFTSSRKAFNTLIAWTIGLVATLRGDLGVAEFAGLSFGMLALLNVLIAGEDIADKRGG